MKRNLMIQLILDFLINIWFLMQLEYGSIWQRRHPQPWILRLNAKLWFKRTHSGWTTLELHEKYQGWGNCVIHNYPRHLYVLAYLNLSPLNRIVHRWWFQDEVSAVNAVELTTGWDLLCQSQHETRKYCQAEVQSKSSLTPNSNSKI